LAALQPYKINLQQDLYGLLMSEDIDAYRILMPVDALDATTVRRLGPE